MYFYDTSALLDDLDLAFSLDEPFYISNITLAELEEIKTSKSKDDAVKQKARKLLRLLTKDKEKEGTCENKCIISTFSELFLSRLDKHTYPIVNNDSKIVANALFEADQNDGLIFKTHDLACAHLASSAGLMVETRPLLAEEYLGYAELNFRNENATASFYNHLSEEINSNLVENQYLLIKVKNRTIDKYKVKNKFLHQVKFPCFESKMFGVIKPRDEFQYMAMDCLKNNQLSVLRGPAGSGKSYLAMGYLFEQLEKNKIEKIIIFCNTVAAMGAARLGFYPGDKNTKLLDSQIGNFLSSKLGGIEEVQRLIEEEKIILIPLADIRGYDTSGMRAGVYITEAQNMSVELMKLALQRIGEDSICILDGDDDAQVDSLLYEGDRNGLKRVSQVFRGQDFYGEVKLNTIYRSKIADIAQNM